jgi:outer membrane protein assembly factor BamA/autotransporter translocation and assembly factor TamB
MSLRGVRVSADTTPDAPFFAARFVEVTLPQSAVLGPFAIETIAVDGARIRIVRERDGRTNLPLTGGGAEGEPDALRLGRFSATDLSVEAIDRASDTTVTLPSIELTLAADSGRLELRKPGSLAKGTIKTTIERLQGDVTFDGRRVHVAGLDLRTDELSARLDGTVALLVAEPRLDVRATTTTDIARAARWASLENPPRGTLVLRADVAGPFSAPSAGLAFESPHVQWQDIEVSDLVGRARATPERVDVERIAARVANGRIDGNATVPLTDDDIVRLAMSWHDVDLESVATIAGVRKGTPRPIGRLTGSLNAHGPIDDVRRWVAEAALDLDGGKAAVNRIPIDGHVNVLVTRGKWGVGTPQPLSVDGLPITATLKGVLNFDAFDRSTVNGGVELRSTTVAHLVGVLRHAGVSVPDTANLEGALEAQAAVSGTFSRPNVTVEARTHVDDVASLAPGTPLRGPADVRINSDLRTAHVTAGVPELNLQADAKVALTAPYHTDAEVTTVNLALERVLSGIETPVPITGVVTATARLSGPIDEWQRGRADVQVDELNATAGALPIRLASPARVSAADLVADVASFEVLAGETRLSAQGRLPLRARARSDGSSDALLATATGDLAQFLNAVAATGVVTMPDVSGSGPAALLARITGSAEKPTISADLELGPGTLQSGKLPAATNVRLRLHSDGTWIEVRDLGAEWQGSHVVASGRAPIAMMTGGPDAPRAGLAALDAQVTSITPEVLAPFVSPEALAEMQGSIDATLHVQSPSLELNDVAGEIRLDRMDVRVAQLPVAQREPTRVSIRNGFARIESWQWVGQGGSVGVQGQVRLSDQTAALLADGRFDLRMLTPFTRGAGVAVAGTLEPRLSIVGPIDDLRIDGAAALSDAEMRLADPRVIATDLDGRIVLTRSRAQLTSLTGSVNGGALKGTGGVTFETGQPIDASLDLNIDAMALEFPEGLRSELDVYLDIAARLPPEADTEPSGTIGGLVTVRRSAYREPIALATGLLSALRTRRLAAEAVSEPSLVDNLSLDVRVVTDENIVVDNNLGTLQLGADLRVIGTLAAPALSGRAELFEDGQLFLGGNRFDIEERGSLDFSNPVVIDPDVNLTARTRAGGEDITLTIKGPLSAPEVTPDSPNPELTKSDLYSLLLTGRKLSDVTGNEADIVREQALALVSGDVFGYASRVVGLDTIRLGGPDEATRNADTSTIATELDPTARLTFMKSIGRTLDVTFSQSLREGDAQTWILDWRPYSQVELRFVSDDETLRSYEFRHDVSFGGTSLAAAVPRTKRQRERVSTVTVSGAATIGESPVRGVLEVGPDDWFDFAEWQRDRDRVEELLHNQGFYEARVNAQREGEGTIALTYTIVEGPPTRLDVIGYELDRETVAALQRAWADAVFDDFLREEVESLVRARLARDGYLSPAVTTAIAAADGTKTLTVRIDSGPRVTSRRVRIQGIEGPIADGLEEWAAQRPAGQLATEDPGGFARAVTSWMRSRGYLRPDVVIGSPIVEGTEAIVPVIVESGPVFLINDVRFDGAQALPAADLESAVGLRANDPFDMSLVDAARERLQARYRREGFTTARVEAQPKIDEEGHGAAITFVITEGPRQVVREVAIDGNRAIDTDVIERTMELPVGKPVTADDWLQARRRLFDTALFRRVDVTPEPLGASEGAEQPMRARVTVQEWPALRLRYGLEVAEERPEGEVEGRDLVPGLSADLTRKTLFGRAVTLGAAVDYRRRDRRARGFVSAPTMFGWPVASSLTAERSREEFTATTLLTDVTSVAAEQRFRLHRNLQLSYAYIFERNHTFDTAGDPDDPFFFDLTVNVATLNTATAWDTRDDVADTTRGRLISTSVDYAPSELGTQFPFVRSLTQAYYFKPFRGTVLASAARLGLAAPMGDNDLIPSKRFRAGGARTVRGVEEEGLGPRNALGEPTGGESLLVLNQEVRFPLYKWLRGVGFVDAGNVFADTRGIDFGDLVTSYGFGVRLATPFALFRVDYGRRFSPGPDDRPRWYFGIGQAF